MNPARALLEFRGDPIQSWALPSLAEAKGRSNLFPLLPLNQFFIIEPRPLRSARQPRGSCPETIRMMSETESALLGDP